MSQTSNGAYKKRPEKPLWMSHWMRPNNNLALQGHDHIPIQHGSGAIRAPPLSIYEWDSRTHQCGEVVVASKASHSGKIVESILGQKKNFSVCDLPASKTQTDNSFQHVCSTMGSAYPHFPSRTVRLISGTELSAREYVSQQDERLFVNHYTLLEKTSLHVLRPFSVGLAVSSSNSVPYGMSSRGKQVESMHIKKRKDPSYSQQALQGHLTSTHFTYLQHENSNFHENPSFLVCDERIDNRLVLRNFGLLPSNNCPLGTNRLEEMRSMVGISGGPSKLPYSTHIFNKTSNGDPTIPTKLTGGTSPENFTLLTDFHCHDKCEVKFQPLGSSSREAEEDIRDLRTGFIGLKNESSAETHTMDINFCQPRKSLSSITSLVPHKAGTSSSNPQQYNSLCPEPNSRGLKRLKPITFVSETHGTKSDRQSSGKVNKLYSKFMDYSKTSLGPTIAKPLGKGQMELEKTMVRVGNNEWFGTHLVKEDNWIKRWCHNEVPNPVTTKACEPEKSKKALHEFERKQFPSIGAMALLGKAMKGFQPCEFQRRGSFVVWNTG